MSSTSYIGWIAGYGGWLGLFIAILYVALLEPTDSTSFFDRRVPRRTERSLFVQTALYTAPLLGSVAFGACLLIGTIFLQTVRSTMAAMFRIDVLACAFATLLLGGLTLGTVLEVQAMQRCTQMSEAVESAEASASESEEEAEESASDDGVVADDEVETSTSDTSATATSEDTHVPYEVLDTTH